MTDLDAPLETLVRRQEDRAAIADLVHRYAQAVRQRRPDLCAVLFAEDGAFEVREIDPARREDFTRRSRAEGRASVEGYVAASTAQAHMVPMIHNLIVDLPGLGEEADRATASSLMVGRVWPGGQEVLGEYADSFVREGAGWVFAERIYTIWRAPSPEASSTTA